MRINDIFVNLYCPKCNYPIGVFLAQIRREESVICTKCEAQIQLEVSGDNLGDVQRALRDLEDQLKNLGGEIVIRL